MWKFNGFCIFLVMIGVVIAKPQSSQVNPTATRSVNKNTVALIDQIFDQNNGNGQNANRYQRRELPSNSKIDVRAQGDTFLGINNEKERNYGCECVLYYQCRNGTINSEGIGLIDIRLQGVCDNYLDICCQVPDVIRNPEEKITPRPTVRRGCGQRHPDGVDLRISRDQNNEAQFGEFPWMVAILRDQDVNGQKLNVYQCGGSLIHPSVVLTAAHCVVGRRPDQLRIRAGEWDTQTESEIYPHQDRDVANFVVHENYSANSLHNDFALLYLSKPFEFAENVDVVCLPQERELFDGARCFASGWGKDIYGKKGRYQVILKSVELPVVSSEICQSNLRKTRLRKHFVLHDSFICAGGEGERDTCVGDGGSPLVCPLRNDPTRYAQAGTVSWGIGCGQKNIPGAYANVAGARLWIDQQLALNNYNTSTYDL